jgi:hypothetical protein
MISLYRLESKRYIIEDVSEMVAFECNEDQAIVYMHSKAISYETIEEALLELIQKAHNVAEFGTFGDFMYTMQSELSLCVKM